VLPHQPPTHLGVSTPGRVCLFGEHQDYLGLPVIAAAISLRVGIEGERRSDDRVTIRLPDIDSQTSFSIRQTFPYELERDYFRSAINVLTRHGFSFTTGFACEVRGNIPINSGTSSSSALNVSWMNFLARMADHPRELSPEELGRFTYEAEVLEFKEPGGMMDQYATAFGGVLYLPFYPSVQPRPITAKLGIFVLGDSREPKDTKSILARVKNRVLECAKRLHEQFPEFSLHTVSIQDLERYLVNLSSEQRLLLRGTIRNRDITSAALSLLEQPRFDEKLFGAMLNEHQSILRDALNISREKINRMISASLSAGALGAKINGSGGGGCMFAYAPKNAEQVAEAIEREGGSTYIVSVAEGSRVEGKTQTPSSGETLEIMI